MTLVATAETVQTREQYFQQIDLRQAGYNCIDDQLSDWALFAHIGGGAGSLGFTRMVMAHIDKPGSARSFAETTADTVGVLAGQGFRHQGVHSSVAEEQGSTVQLDRHEGAIGCGYMQLRREISQGIAQNGQDYIDEAARLFPDYFSSEADYDYARQVVGAHAWFSAVPSRIDPGRSVFMSAKSSGAQAMLVRGGHAADEGIINTQPGTTFDTNAAYEDGLPCYDFDIWASSELLQHMPEGLDARQAATANLIDTVGAMRALGVTEIARR